MDPSGSALAVSSADGQIVCVNFTTGEVGTLPGHTGGTMQLAWVSSSTCAAHRHVLCAGQPRSFASRSPERVRPRRFANGMTEVLLSSGEDGMVKSWNPLDGTLLAEHRCQGDGGVHSATGAPQNASLDISLSF